MAWPRQFRKSLLLPVILGVLLLLLAFLSVIRTDNSVQCIGPGCPGAELKPWANSDRESWRTLMEGSSSSSSDKADPFPYRRMESSITESQETTVPAAPPPPSTLSFIMPEEVNKIITQLYDYIERPQTQICRKSVRIGGQPDYRWKHFDGYKWMCLDRQFQLLQTDRCLIYSFGVDHDWSFDDDVQLLQCEIHAFDPSVGQQDHNRSARIAFHNIGIGNKDEVITVKGRQWSMKTYGSVVHMLGHQNRTIHYLKVDVEGAEWPMFGQIASETPQLLHNVHQIGMEIHMGLGPLRKPSLSQWQTFLQTFINLERAGFRLFHAEVNPYEPPKRYFTWTNRLMSGVYELVWLRVV